MRANGAGDPGAMSRKLSGTRTLRIPVGCLHSIPCHKGMIVPETPAGPFTAYPPDDFKIEAIGKNRGDYCGNASPLAGTKTSP